MKPIPAPGTALPNPRRVGVLRLSAIGDVCHMVAVIRAIQKHLPETKMSWVIGSLEHSLVEDLPDIEFITVRKHRGWVHNWRQLREHSRQQPFDVLLQTQYALRASVLATALRAGQRVGYDRQRARDLQWLFTGQSISAAPQQHVFDAYFEFARWLGVPDTHLDWSIPVADQDCEFADQLCGQVAGPIAILSPAASSARRNWHTDRYARVVEQLVRSYGVNVLLTGSPAAAEISLCAEIEHLSQAPVINLAGQTSLKQLMALLQRASLLITPDSGPAHMGNAAGIPVIGLYAASDPNRTGPYNRREYVINHYPKMLRELMHKEPDEVRFGTRIKSGDPMASIQVDDVMEKVSAILDTAT